MAILLTIPRFASFDHILGDYFNVQKYQALIQLRPAQH
jgi:hypothetical protein